MQAGKGLLGSCPPCKLWSDVSESLVSDWIFESLVSDWLV